MKAQLENTQEEVAAGVQGVTSGQKGRKRPRKAILMVSTEWPQPASIIAVQEPNMSFGPIPGYQSRQTHPSQRPPSIKCSHTRKRAQYRKSDFWPQKQEKNILPRIGGPHSVPESEISFASFSVNNEKVTKLKMLTNMEFTPASFWPVCALVIFHGVPENWTINKLRIAVFACTLLRIIPSSKQILFLL